jgi:hypothetical protein
MPDQLDLDPQELHRVLDGIGNRPTSGPDPAFVARLEQQLVNGVASVTPLDDHRGRRSGRLAHRVTRVTVLAAVGSIAAAAVAVAVVGHEVTKARVETPADAPTTPAPPAPPTTAISSATFPVVIPPASLLTGLGDSPSTTLGPVSAPPGDSATTTAAAPPVEPATTKAAPKIEPTTTKPSTEVTTPATLTLSCVASADGPKVTCEWGASTSPDVTGYLIYRGQSGGGTGRVFQVGAGDHRYVDSAAIVAGTPYLYLVKAINAAGAILDHSPLVAITWP